MKGKSCKNSEPKRVRLTLRGQVLAGDGDAALKGLRKLLSMGQSNAVRKHD